MNNMEDKKRQLNLKALSVIEKAIEEGDKETSLEFLKIILNQFSDKLLPQKTTHIKVKGLEQMESFYLQYMEYIQKHPEEKIERDDDVGIVDAHVHFYIEEDGKGRFYEMFKLIKELNDNGYLRIFFIIHSELFELNGLGCVGGWPDDIDAFLLYRNFKPTGFKTS